MKANSREVSSEVKGGGGKERTKTDEVEVLPTLTHSPNKTSLDDPTSHEFAAMWPVEAVNQVEGLTVHCTVHVEGDVNRVTKVVGIHQ